MQVGWDGLDRAVNPWVDPARAPRPPHHAPPGHGTPTPNGDGTEDTITHFDIRGGNPDANGWQITADLETGTGDAWMWPAHLVRARRRPTPTSKSEPPTATTAAPGPPNSKPSAASASADHRQPATPARDAGAGARGEVGCDAAAGDLPSDSDGGGPWSGQERAGW